MPNRAEQPHDEKPPREDVSSPRQKQILNARIAQLSEGPAIVFLVAEKPEPNEINQEASDRGSALCPKCKSKIVARETLRDTDGDVSYWNVECPTCGLHGKVWND